MSLARTLAFQARHLLSRALPSAASASTPRLAPPANRAFSASATMRAAGPIESAMHKKLTEALGEEATVKIRNDSSKHAHHAAMVAQGGGSGETHFFIDAISPSFAGQAQLARHRRINGLMQEEFDAGLHALSLRLKTPEEDVRESERMEKGK